MKFIIFILLLSGCNDSLLRKNYVQMIDACAKNCKNGLKSFTEDMCLCQTKYDYWDNSNDENLIYESKKRKNK